MTDMEPSGEEQKGERMNNIEQIKVGDLKPFDRNAKKHDERQIKNVMESIKQFGFVQPIVVDKDNVLIIGHCRLIAAKRLKMREVPCIRMEDLSPEDVDRLRVLDNKLNESEWDITLLLEDIPTLDFSDFDIDWGLPEIEEETEVIEDEVPEPPKEAKTKPGDIYLLGRHRLLCGDATKAEDVSRLLNGVKADLYLTDPPYNVAYEGSTKDKLTIMNDNMGDAQFREFLRASFDAAKQNIKPGASFYIWHADSEGYNFRGACRDVGWQVRECLIWKKNSMVLGRQDYQWQHEPCLYGWSEGGSHAWYSDRKQTTILEFNKPQKNGEHPKMKPIALFDYLIKNSSKKGDIVLDTFGGSGTTIIACEQNGRCGYSTELDPKYCDVIVERWEKLTGKKAELLEEGK